VSELVSRAGEKAKAIFKVQVSLAVNNESLPPKSFPPPFCAYYNCYKDEVTVYTRRMQQVAEMHDLDLDKMVAYIICHEYGHAKQARIFESSQICPWYLRMRPQCIVELSGVGIPLERADVNFVIDGLLDFCVDKELHKHGISIPWAKSRLRDLKLKPGNADEAFLYVRTKELPVDISFYEFGELSDSEKEAMKVAITEWVGGRWDKVYRLVGTLEFWDPNRYCNVLETLITVLFGQCVAFLLTSSALIFRGRNRPSFWDNNQYFVPHVMPKSVQ